MIHRIILTLIVSIQTDSSRMGELTLMSRILVELSLDLVAGEFAELELTPLMSGLITVLF